jgi:hypothetical protein
VRRDDAAASVRQRRRCDSYFYHNRSLKSGSVGLLGPEDVGSELLGGFPNVLHDLSDTSARGLVATSGFLDVILARVDELPKVFVGLHSKRSLHAVLSGQDSLRRIATERQDL